MMIVSVLYRFSAAAVALAGTHRITLAVPSAPSAPAGTSTATAAPVYQEGYDPAKGQREGIGTLPETAWGEPLNGLRAALTGPDKVRFNEQAEYQLVLRNVSEAAVRVAVAEDTFAKCVMDEGRDGGRQLDSYTDRVTRWILQPGQQTVVRAARMLCTEAGDLSPGKALSEMIPGRYVLTLGFGAGRGTEVTTPDGKRTFIPPPPGEWSGWLKTGPRSFELLAEKVPLEVLPPPELPAGYPGLAPSTDYPPQLREGGAFSNHLELGRPGFWLLPHPWLDMYWLQDSYPYDRNVYWGPFTEMQMQQAGLVKLLEAWGLSRLTTGERNPTAAECIGILLRGEGPMAAAGLRLAAQVTRPLDRRTDSFGHFPRFIRERRRTFLRAGLEKEMRAALDNLTKNDPPLPPATEFTVISTTELPKGLPATAWGPEDEGLRAAALMPEVWRDGDPVPVRLFIRNVSNAPIYLTVSENAGYDYPSAVDVLGNEAKVKYAQIQSPVMVSVERPEVDPGQTPTSPAMVKLRKILLQPGAIYEAPSPGAVRWLLPVSAKDKSTTKTKVDPDNPDSPIFATISGTSSNLSEGRHEAVISWHLHCTNGTGWDEDLRKHFWPAKGGWSGVLETGPLRVTLKPK
jgi:hypothetical protein